MTSSLTSLGALGTIRQGLTLSRYLDASGPRMHVLQVANLTGTTVTLDKKAENRQEALDARRVEEHLARPNQVLISLRGSSLKAAVVPHDLKPAVVSSSLVILEPDLRLADPAFLAGLLSSDAMQAQVAPLFTGLTVQGIPLSRFKEIQIHLPPMELQRHYAAAFQALATYQQEVDKLIDLWNESLNVRLDQFIVKERG